jgi:hypothetical protein
MRGNAANRVNKLTAGCRPLLEAGGERFDMGVLSCTTGNFVSLTPTTAKANN